MSSPAVSVVIPVYNAETYLRRAVDSVLRERSRGISEILLVEDGSTDDSLAVCNALIAEHPDLICLFRHPDSRNHGAGATRNLGMDKARGDLLCFLDADDFWYPARLDEALSILREHPSVDGVYDVCEYVFSDEQSKARFGAGGNALIGPKFPVEPDHLFDMLFDRRVPLWCSNGIVLRRRSLNRVGRMNESLRLGQDVEFWMRIAMVLRLLGSPSGEPKAVYWRHAGNRWSPDRDPKGFLNWIRRETMFLLSWHEWLLHMPVAPQKRERVLRRLMRYLGWLGRFSEAWHIARAHNMPAVFLYAILFSLPEKETVAHWLRRIKWEAADRLRSR